MKTFYAILANSLVASLTNTFVWFAVTFWVYLETKSVIATSVMAGVYTTTVAVSGFFLGSLVDRYPKKTRDAAFERLLAAAVCARRRCSMSRHRADVFADPASAQLWVFIVLTLVGAIVGNLRSIALSTLVTILIPEDGRDRANGMVGTANGVAFLVASILSGLAIGFLGVFWMLVSAIVLTALVIVHLWTIAIPDQAAAARRSAGEQRQQHRHSRHDPRHPAGARAVRADLLPYLQQLPGRRLHVADGCLRPVAGVGAGLGHRCGAS